jgi:chromosome segregation ATPase
LENELTNVQRENQQLKIGLETQKTQIASLENKLAKVQDENKTQIAFLKNEIANVQSENSLMKCKMDDLNSTSTLLLQQNTILEEKLKKLNATCILVQQNGTTIIEDIKRLEDVLTFEIGQEIRDTERKVMTNISAAIKDLQIRDRYLSLSLLDAHNTTATLKSSLEELQTLTKHGIQNLSLSLHTEISKLNDSLSNIQSTCTYNYLITCTHNCVFIFRFIILIK